ncbi:MAG: DUF1836 domain-containing protein [Firmicutes bacterium]|nr:DUF1836 domain-containing protein [Bacillota bacterium]
MSKEMDELKKWCGELSEFSVGNWDEWPDIDLYMDQVISYLDKYMNYFRIYDDEKMITPSIINNNTKDGVLPKPVKKKYSRSLLSTLLIFCITRQVLSGQELSTMLGEITKSEDFASIHKNFGDILESQLKHTVEQIESDTNNFETADRWELAQTAMRLSLEAFAAGIAARKILSELEIKEDDK